MRVLRLVKDRLDEPNIECKNNEFSLTQNRTTYSQRTSFELILFSIVRCRRILMKQRFQINSFFSFV